MHTHTLCWQLRYVRPSRRRPFVDLCSQEGLKKKKKKKTAKHDLRSTTHNSRPIERLIFVYVVFDQRHLTRQLNRMNVEK
jgi:hypothetical protein